MCVQRLVHRILVGFTFRISGLHVTYGCPALSACYDCYVYLLTMLEYTYGCITLSRAYLFKLYLEDQRVGLDLWVSNLKCSLTWLPPSSDSEVEST